MSLPEIFANTILPIFIVAAIGFFLARRLGAQAKTLSTVTFNVLSPALIFNALVTSTISANEFGRMALFSVCVIFLAGLLGFGISRAMRLDQGATSAFVIVAMFANAGNYGLPLVLFAFGQEALARAAVYLVIHMVLLYSVGVVLASSGQSGFLGAVRGILKVPHFYAISAAVIVLVLGIRMPEPVMRSVGLLNSAALPVMILLMGMQLERSALPKQMGPVWVATSLRLVGIPLVALALTSLFGMTGTERQAAVIQASMPAAVMITVLSLQYNSAPEFSTAVVFLTTVLSPVTLTLLISYLQH
jgi:malate permease and related proteins